MQITSAEASKMLKSLVEERDSLLKKEERSREFIVSLGEDIESLRPQYSITEAQEQLDKLNKKIITLKHFLNVFNATTVVGDTGMTIDQVLVALPQLTQRKKTLQSMKDRLPKERAKKAPYSNSNIVEYSIANYDIDIAAAVYDKVSKDLAKMQTELDQVNSSVTFEYNE